MDYVVSRTKKCPGYLHLESGVYPAGRRKACKNPNGRQFCLNQPQIQEWDNDFYDALRNDYKILYSN